MSHQTYITDYNCISPLGFSVKENWKALCEDRTGVKTQYFSEQFPEVCASIIDSEKIQENFSLNFDNQNFTRLEKLLILSLKPLIEKHPVSEKSLLILSTTKGNVSLLKNQDEAPKGSFLSELAQKIADFFNFKTKPIVVSNACVSGVMAVSVAKNLLQNDNFSDVFVIAGDEVTEFVLSGFNSFQAMSAKPSKPYDKNRDGINIGEAAAAVFVTKQKPKNQQYFEILGDSSINDANHISGPSRNGEGLFKSITNALKEAKISADEIDYISAHGTATIYNDEMESFAFSRAGMSEIPLNSLKGFYGHCLGASGLLEMIMVIESAKHNFLIKNLNFEENGVSQPINVILKNTEKQIDIILKTASGFGGCNSALILKKRNEED